MRYVALSLLSFLPFVTIAQEVTGSITGTVMDPAGGAVPGAAITVISRDTGAVRNGIADAAGSFVVTALPPGMFNLSVEYAGFKKYEKQSVELAPGRHCFAWEHAAAGRLEYRVSDGKSGRIDLQLSSSERAGTITSEEIKDLTIMNRDFSQFAELMPGVVANVTQEVQTFSGNTTFNVSGGRTTGNNILIDGMPSGNSNQIEHEYDVESGCGADGGSKACELRRGVRPQSRHDDHGGKQGRHATIPWRRILLHPERGVQCE